MEHATGIASAATTSPGIPASGTGAAMMWSRTEHAIDVAVRMEHAHRIEFGELQYLSLLIEESSNRSNTTTAFIVCDRHNVQTLGRVESQLQKAGITMIGTFAHSGDERDKSIQCVQEIWESMRTAGALRRTLILGLGGGVVCDIAGFVASTFMRGLPYLLIPTTLMAQVDAAIGGKVGANFLGQKNLIGAFSQSVGVFIDSSLVLKTPQRIIAAGASEVVKVAAIASPHLFDIIEDLDWSHLDRHINELDIVVRSAIQIKLSLLCEDPNETRDLRRALNFGHCVGHAIESELAYSWLHGECVAAGMAIACRTGLKAGITSHDAAARIQSLLKRLDLPSSVPAAQATATWNHLEHIGRVRNGSLNLVVPESIGETAILRDWPHDVSWESVL